MSWFYERRVYPSEKNGDIVCQRNFGKWDVFVGELHMSSEHLRGMWRGVHRRLPIDFSPKEILMFGLAAGDNVTLLSRKYPQSWITAVEWDPVMVRIAEEIGDYPAHAKPKFIVADAGEVVRTLPGPFDLILVDIFRGGAVAHEAYVAGFFGQVSRLLSGNGLVIVNSFRERQLLDTAAKSLRTVTVFEERENNVGIFGKDLLK